MQWTKQGCFYSLAGSNDWRKSHSQLPVIDSSSDECWRIYYSSRNQHGKTLPCSIDIEPGNPASLIADNFHPLLELGAPGSFDADGVMPTAIIDHQGKKYLYYVGWSTDTDMPYQNSIGLAISEDNGHSYQRYSDQPVIGVNAQDPLFTGTLGIYKVGSIWHGYYMSCSEWRPVDGGVEPRYRLKYASSEDGINWQRNNQIAIDFSDPEEGGIVAASVIEHRGKYHMWYCFRRDRDFRINPKNSYRIGYAVSDDAVHWQRIDAAANISVSASGWDSQMICYPAVVRHEKKLIMFYNGNGFGQSGIGYATSSIE